MTSHVEQRVQARIEQARAKVQAAQRQRDELSSARRRGIAARHANKLRHLAEQEQRQADAPDGQDHDDRASVRTTDGSAEDTPSSGNTTEGAAP